MISLIRLIQVEVGPNRITISVIDLSCSAPIRAATGFNADIALNQEMPAVG
jgi:hypothetical protein